MAGEGSGVKSVLINELSGSAAVPIGLCSPQGMRKESPPSSTVQGGTHAESRDRPRLVDRRRRRCPRGPAAAAGRRPDQAADRRCGAGGHRPRAADRRRLQRLAPAERDARAVGRRPVERARRRAGRHGDLREPRAGAGPDAADQQGGDRRAADPARPQGRAAPGRERCRQLGVPGRGPGGAAGERSGGRRRRAAARRPEPG